MRPRRVVVIMVLAIWATLWPHNYGYDAHNAWLRLGAILLLTFRALFIGYACTFLVLRPMLAFRKPGQDPYPSARQMVRMLWRQLREEREQSR